MNNIINLPVVTTLNSSADRVLEAAQGELEEVVIIGFTTEGDEYFSSSVADSGSVIYHLERAKHKLLKLADELDN